MLCWAGSGVSTMLRYSTYFIELLDETYGLGISLLVSWFHGDDRCARLDATGHRRSVEGRSCGAVRAAGSPWLNTLALGEEHAAGASGLAWSGRVSPSSSPARLLVAAAVSLGGLISFVGLVVPHLVRLIMGPDNVRLFPVTAVAGAIFLVLADTAARTILAPTEVPVGVLTAFIGGPFFLYLLRRSKREYAR